MRSPIPFISRFDRLSHESDRLLANQRRDAVPAAARRGRPLPQRRPRHRLLPIDDADSGDCGRVFRLIADSVPAARAAMARDIADALLAARGGMAS
jgi:hypothetical protein